MTNWTKTRHGLWYGNFTRAWHPGDFDPKFAVVIGTHDDFLAAVDSHREFAEMDPEHHKLDDLIFYLHDNNIHENIHFTEFGLPQDFENKINYIVRLMRFDKDFKKSSTVTEETYMNPIGLYFKGDLFFNGEGPLLLSYVNGDAKMKVAQDPIRIKNLIYGKSSLNYEELLPVIDEGKAHIKEQYAERVS